MHVFYTGHLVDPQGPFGRMFRKLRIQGRIQIFKKNVPEGFKSCFDTGFEWYKSRAAISAKNYGFTKQKHIRGDKTLKV